MAFPELSVLPELLGGRRVALDGELVVLNDAGVSDFSRLQRRIGVRVPSPGLLREAPATLYVSPPNPTVSVSSAGDGWS